MVQFSYSKTRYRENDMYLIIQVTPRKTLRNVTGMLVNLRLESDTMTSKVPNRQRDLRRRLQDEAPDSSSSDGSFIHNRRQSGGFIQLYII